MTDPTPHPDPAVALTADEARQAIIESLSWRESLGVGRWGHEVATAILDDYLAARTADAADRPAAVRAREVADLLAVHRLYGEDGDDYYECGCGEWTPADCMERDFGDLLWHEGHVASLIAALSTAPDADATPLRVGSGLSGWYEVHGLDAGQRLPNICPTCGTHHVSERVGGHGDAGRLCTCGDDRSSACPEPPNPTCPQHADNASQCEEQSAADALRQAADALGHVYQGDSADATACIVWLRARADRMDRP